MEKNTISSDSNLVINWFPGHMVTALRMIEKELRLCDVIIYVLDSRAPMSTLNPKFDELILRKPVLFVLNKADLAVDGVALTFREKVGGHKVVALDSTKSGALQKISNIVEKMVAGKIQTATNKGIKKVVRAIVIGVTNSGKSTLINNLANKGKAQAANRPGVTRGKQWVEAGSHFYVLDTPGTLYPSKMSQPALKNLAYLGSIKDDVIDFITLSKYLIIDLEVLEPGCIERRFGAKEFDEIALKRGYTLKGGVIDEERCAKALLTEFRAGKIGKFNLDKLL